MSPIPTTSEEGISSDFPFTKKSVAVHDSSIAYIDVGPRQGPVVVFLHGNPTSSYLWRNIIPLISPETRCVAPDLIGFGDSGKVPNLEYRIVDHQNYLDAFLNIILPNEQIILVVHDWGSALGFDWASRHDDRVVGLAFMEFIAPADSWDDLHESAAALRAFRQPELGRKLAIDDNIFVEHVLQAGILRQLSDDEMTHYRKPFLVREHREPVYRFPNELPIEGQPHDIWTRAQKYTAWLLSSDKPKLFFWATPGGFMPERRAKKFAEELQNTRTVFIGPGSHFVQEDHPNLIGTEIATWIRMIFAGQ
jgi:haloalkane dehalogenase